MSMNVIVFVSDALSCVKLCSVPPNGNALSLFYFPKCNYCLKDLPSRSIRFRAIASCHGQNYPVFKLSSWEECDPLSDSALLRKISFEIYTDNAALSVASYWGTVLGGNVSGAVRELTRRLRGAGNAVLAFDGFLGELEETSAGYTGRFGPWVVGAAVDEEGDLDLGATFQRPAGTRDWRATLRAAEGAYTPAGGPRFDTRGFGVVGEVIYGSTTVDAGAGYEHFSTKGPDSDRWYVSSGVRTKTGALTLSLEGQVGRIEGKDEASAALGAQYDIARGLSANLGLNHAKARVSLDGASFLDIEETKTVLSLRYSF